MSDFGYSWHNIVIDNEECLISSLKENNVWKIFLTDLIEVWIEELSPKVILERCKDLNPLLKVDASELEEIIEEILRNVEKYTVDIKINEITLHRDIQGGILIFRINLSRANQEQFYQIVTRKFFLSSNEVLRRYILLLELIVKKDTEIAEYKAEGAQLIRKSLETEPFTKDLFKVKCSENKLNFTRTFRTIIDVYNESRNTVSEEESECSDSKKSLIDCPKSISNDKDVLRKMEESIRSPELELVRGEESNNVSNKEQERYHPRAKKKKGAISASFTKPIKRVKNPVSSFIA